MSDDKNQNEFKSFKFGNYKIRFSKNIFKYVLIIGVIIFAGYPYLNLNIPTHSLTHLKNFKETKWILMFLVHIVVVQKDLSMFNHIINVLLVRGLWMTVVGGETVQCIIPIKTST